MLTINKIKLEHFMCCTDVSLDFSNKKTIVLEGDNGNGKSALLDSIAVCLAEHRRADKYSEYVQFGYDFAKIHLEAEINNEPIIFDVTLYVKGGTPFTRVVNYKGKSYQNTEVSKLLKELDLPFYSQIVFSMQGQDDIATMTPVVRASYLQRLLQFNFDSALSTIKNKLSEIETNKMYNKTKIEFNENEIKNKSFGEKTQLPYDIDTFKSKQNLLINYENQLKEKDDIYKLLSNIQCKISDINISLQDLKNKKENNETSKALLSSYNDKLLSETIKLKSLVKPELKEFEKIKEIKNVIKDKKELYSNNEKLLWNLNSEIKVLREREKLYKKGKCPNCGQDTTFIQKENITEKIDEKTKQIEKLKKENDTINFTIDDLENKVYDLEIQKSENTQELNDYKSNVIIIQSKIDNLRKMINSIQIKEFVDNSQELLKEKITLSNEEKNLKDKLNFLVDLEKEKLSLKKDIDFFTEIITRNEWIDSNNKKVQEEIDILKNQIDIINKLLIDQEKQYEHYKEAKKILDNDLPNYLIIKTCSRLESEMNDFIKIVFPTMSVSLFQNKKGVEFYYSKDSTDKLITAKMASGFEKSILSIAFKVALCKAYNLSLAILDEIDAFASDNNSEKTYTTLIENNIFNQLFITTHKPSTREILKDYFDDITFYHVERGKFTEIN